MLYYHMINKDCSITLHVVVSAYGSVYRTSKTRELHPRAVVLDSLEAAISTLDL